MKWTSLALGVLALIALEVLVSTPTGPVTSLLALPAAAAKRIIDPTIPLISGMGSKITGPTLTLVPPLPPDAPVGPQVPSAQEQLLKGATP